jgi:hypothetical protein
MLAANQFSKGQVPCGLPFVICRQGRRIPDIDIMWVQLAIRDWLPDNRRGSHFFWNSFMAAKPFLTLTLAVLALHVFGVATAPVWGQQAPGQSAGAAPKLPGAGLSNAAPKFLAHVAVDHDDGVYREGETLKVQFVAEREARLYLLYHQADGRCLLLFPNVARSDNRVPARQIVRIPNPAEPFRFRVGPPFGVEVLQVVATDQPIRELDLLMSQGQGRGPAVSPELLEQVRHGLMQPGKAWAEHRVPIRTLPLSERAPSRQPIRAGLFIGVGKYLNPKLAATHEELRHSAEVLHEQMLRRGGLDPSRTKLVVDQQATRAHLEELITRWLPGVTQPGDTVFLYFSGHAGTSPNRDGSEPDGLDEMIGPYDVDAGATGMTVDDRRARFRDSSIVDDVLARWIEELSGRHVVLILDTCHSGGVVEGKGLSRFFGDEAARVKDIAQLDVTVLTSCAADEQALFEGTPNKTMWFTYFLAQAVETLPSPVTVRAAFHFCKTGLRQVLDRWNEARDQEPALTENSLVPIPLVP